jgi:uncharacterized membrane protein
MSRLGGAGALPSLVNDMPAEVFSLPLSLYITFEYCRWYFWFSSMSMLACVRFVLGDFMLSRPRSTEMSAMTAIAGWKQFLCIGWIFWCPESRSRRFGFD